MYGTSFPEEGEVKGFDFSDKTVRRDFIKKVYLILTFQLLITLTLIAFCLYHKSTQQYVATHPGLFFFALIAYFVAFFSLVCCDTLRRKTPLNYVFLFVYTLAQAFMLAIVSSSYKSEEVVMAVGITASVFLVFTLYAFLTKYDFTVLSGPLLVAVLILMMFTFVCIMFPSKVLSMVYASVAALIFSVYLIYDTQLMMGGVHRHAISPEEYIFAALTLYMDIVRIFTVMLQLIGLVRNN